MPRQKAVVVDIDETICTQFDCPVSVACDTLRAIDRSVAVHYVTARPEASRRGTDQFLSDHRLPGWKNVHYCPNWKSSLRHKTEILQALAKEYTLLVSIGDADEDAAASVAAGVVFLRVTDDAASAVWAEFRRMTEVL